MEQQRKGKGEGSKDKRKRAPKLTVINGDARSLAIETRRVRKGEREREKAKTGGGN